MVDESIITPETPEEPAGLDIDATVADIAQSLRLVSPEEELAGESTEGGEPAAEGAVTVEPVEPVEPVAAPAVVEELVPDTWRPAAKEKWAAVDPVVRQEIQKREGDIAKYVAETSQSVQVAKGFEKIIEPFAPLFNQYGVNPWEHIPKLLHAHATMLFGKPEVKVQMFRQLAMDAGIDLGKMQAGEPVQNDQSLEMIRGLQREIASLKQGVTGVTTTVQEARATELEGSVLAFAQDEKHPYFWEVTDEIQHFINTKSAHTLDEAYQLAIMANPLTKAKVIKEEVAKATANSNQLAAARAVKAKKAAAGTVKSSGRGRAASPTGSIDDTLKAALSEINSRETH